MAAALAAESDDPQFRNGIPVRMMGWIHVKLGRLSRRQPRYAKLLGEVLSFHQSENHPPDEEFDVVGSAIEFSDRESRRSFRIAAARRVYTCYCGSFEEMQSWAQSLMFASAHSFDAYYTLGSQLAEGTFSRVYYAYAQEDDAKVFAVKVVKKRAHDLQALEWLRRERHVNSVLNHPTIVHAVDMFSSTERDFLVFELMEGGTLADLLRKHKRLPESYARVVMRELFTALHYIHSKNIVHRDVRPENIFCSATKFPMSIALGDFGLSNFLSEKRVNNEVLTSMVGTPPYIPIDIVRRVKYGPIADMWSAGVVLFELLSGHLPFAGRTDREVVEKIKAGVYDFPADPWAKVSDEAKGLVRQLLQPDPYKRISALASLQHRWLNPSASLLSAGPTPTSAAAALARPMSMNNTLSMPTSPNSGAGAGAFGDRGSPGTTSTDSRQRHSAMPSSLSNMSRVASSTSSASPHDGTSSAHSHQLQDRSELGGVVSERQTSLLGIQQQQLQQQQQQQQQPGLVQQSSMRSMQMQHVSSMSSLSAAAAPRLAVTPSVRAIAEKGLQRVASDNPARMRRLLSSKVVQKQLSLALPYRRRLIVAARAFVAVFRMQALARGHSATRQLSLMGKTDVDGLNEMLDRRKKALEDTRNSSSGGSGASKDRDAGAPMPAAVKRSGGHVRQRSREITSQLIGRLSHDRKTPAQQEVGGGGTS